MDSAGDKGFNHALQGTQFTFEDPIMRLPLSIAAAALLLAGCGEKPPQANTTAPAAGNMAMDVEDVPANEEPGTAADADLAEAPPTDAWIGKWTGVEGLALDIARTETPGSYTLTVALMDGSNVYAGKAEGETITFQRGGTKETIRPATGDETGLKWLAGKKDCLMIKPAEGFCRG